MKLTPELKNSLLISFLLHLLPFFIFNLTLFSPQRTPLRKIEISFFGSLLADYGKQKTEGERSYLFFAHRRVEEVMGERIKSSPDISSHPKQVCTVIPERPLFIQESIEYAPLTGETNRERFIFSQDKPYNLLSLSIKETSSPLLSYTGKDEDLTLRVRFFIAENGVVQFVEPYSFSGNPEWDISVLKTIKGWTFLPYGNWGRWYEIDFSPRIMAKKND
ncbi:MAG: hypothetical protein NC898_00730 [Candidatus Omnitrophica bacterium]|nr:hypothetical protein [Candidatus Omnitrophota bacterium]MCM8792982.1 hypothetical protein [Candidatus Omnitrophota bacterium]